MSTIRIRRESRCSCGQLIDAATGVGAAANDAGPIEGAVSLCLGCGKLSIFNADLTLRPPTAEEARDLALNPLIVKAQLLIAGFPRT